MAVTEIPLPTGDDLIARKNAPQEVIRFNSVVQTNANKVLFASPRRLFTIENSGSNPVYVGVLGQTLDGIDPTSLPSGDIAEVPAPSGESSTKFTFQAASRLSALFIQSSTGASAVQVVAEN